MDFKHHPGRHLNYLFASPFIYGMIVPLVFLDICIEIYHRICFSLYDLPYVKRSQYIKIDRQKLLYLNWFEKLNCMYCGYANGLFHYAGAIAAATEKYFCGIRHKLDKEFKEPSHHKEFLEYGDEEAYERFLERK